MDTSQPGDGWIRAGPVHRLACNSPLGKGFLTGAIDQSTTFDSSDFRNVLPRFTPEARLANQAMVQLLGDEAFVEVVVTVS